MKSPYLLPALTALIGFSTAWILKPSQTPALVTAEPIAPNHPVRPDVKTRASSTDAKQPAAAKSHDFPLADLADQGPKSRDEAKMLRLTEALGLSIDQQGAIIKLVEDIQATADGNVPVIADLTSRGKAIEAGLSKVLTPEQLSKFQELQARERDNRVELRSQRMLTQAIDEIDLTPEQREAVLNRLRQKSKTEMQSIPAAATLLLDKSLLPTGSKELSVDGVLQLAQLGESEVYATPMEAHQKVIDHQRQELEEILKCFDGILSPAQMGQYQAALAEQRAILSRMPTKAGQSPGE